MSVRAKFKCTKNDKSGEGESQTASIAFNAEYGDGTENASWSKATPSGALQMTVTNPSAIDQFEVGKEYYLDFTPA